ncbi:hypothetical protein K523DRAFT_410945 [Schizophyllum commune Tattone D]|nr:hypothetical protein K523DRAFT_410945 [Schizophyllum commune Tattone D]
MSSEGEASDNEEDATGGSPSDQVATTSKRAAPTSLPFTLPRGLRRMIPPSLLLGDEDDPFRRRTVLNGTPPLPAVMGISLHSVKAANHTVEFLGRMKERYGDRWRAISVDLHSCGLSAEVWRTVEAAHPNAFLSLSTGINMRQPHGSAASSSSSDPSNPSSDPSTQNTIPPIPKSLSTLILSAHPSRLLAESDWHDVGESGQRTWEMLNIIARVKGWDVEGVSGRGARNVVVRGEEGRTEKANNDAKANEKKKASEKKKGKGKEEKEAGEEGEGKEVKEAKEVEGEGEKTDEPKEERSTSRGRKRSAEEAAEGDDDVSSPAPSKRSRSSPSASEGSTPPPGTDIEGAASDSSSSGDEKASTSSEASGSTSSNSNASRGRKRSAEVAAEGDEDSAPTASRPSPPKRSRSSPTPEAEGGEASTSTAAGSSSTTLASSSTSTSNPSPSIATSQAAAPLPRPKKTRPPGNPYAAGAHRIADPHRQGRVPQDTHEVPRAVRGPGGALHAPSITSLSSSSLQTPHPPGTTPLTGLATVPHVPSASTPGYAAPNIHVVRRLHENWVRFRKGNHGVPPPVSRKQRRMARHARYDEWEEEERARGED